jgi:hypothetical protein
MSTQGDVLLVDGGFVSPSGTMEWEMTLPANLATVVGDLPGAILLPDSSAITGCIISALLSQTRGAPSTTGPVSIADCRDHWQALERLGIGAAPLRCGPWSPGDTHLDRFRGRFGRNGR